MPATHAAAQDWSGAYVGIAASSIQYEAEGFVTPIPAVTWYGENSTGVGTLFVGYDWQVGPREVVGVEFDYSFSLFGSGRTDTFAIQAINEELSNVASARVRFGYAFDNILPYVSVGLTSADYELSTGGVLTPTSRTRNVVGTTVGVGIDYLIGEAHQLRVELLHTQFDDQQFPQLPVGITAVTSTGINYSELRVGYAYRF